MREHDHAPPVLYEDESVIAVDKPAGIPVIPARNEGDRCLRALVEAARRESLWVVHRIDRDTSGVVVFARTRKAHRALSMAFEARKIEKRYVAFVRSDVRAGEGDRRITTALHEARKGKMRPALEGERDSLASETVVTFATPVKTTVGFVSRVDARPLTGRQHQIRVHLRSIHTPLLVDGLYGGATGRAEGALGDGSPALDRLTLHAATLSFAHPTTHERLVIESPLASDLAELDRWLAARQS
ncbi:MAG: RluA family pseudouridine synthase [Myxococcales bacterium]|nr:RluA family pseudouridine synthase [Myxococcales bacterium]